MHLSFLKHFYSETNNYIIPELLME